MCLEGIMADQIRLGMDREIPALLEKIYGWCPLYGWVNTKWCPFVATVIVKCCPLQGHATAQLPV